MQRYAYRVYYDGARFYGFQRQPERRTVEGELIKALGQTRAIPDNSNFASARFATAGRTDRFASALGNVFAVNLVKDLPPAAINSRLRDDLRVWARTQVPISFNPRRALRRHYKYFIHASEDIDLTSLIEASTLFLGVHDFRRFAHRPPTGSSIREITEITASRLNDNAICVSIIGDSFLQRMVRKIVGSLIYVATSLLTRAELERLFNPSSPLPPMGVPSAPPENLILWDIDYGFPFYVDKYAVEKLQSTLAKNLMAMQLKNAMLNALRESTNRI